MAYSGAVSRLDNVLHTIIPPIVALRSHTSRRNIYEQLQCNLLLLVHSNDRSLP
jgi:hypothetical protein